MECYYLYNEPCRNNKPAKYLYSTTGLLTTVEYYENGQLHRDDDLPALIKYDTMDKIILEKYYRLGKLYRINKF